MSDIDEDALVAVADLVGRSGARDFEVGYHDEKPAPGALNWYAQANFKGARLFSEGRDPVEAAERLARRLLKGARCRRCGRPIRLGTARPGCRWRREGARWVPGCGRPINADIPLEGYQRGR